MTKRILLGLLISSVFKLLILLSSVYSFIRSGIEYSCVLSRPGTIQTFRDFDGYITTLDVYGLSGDNHYVNPILGENKCEIQPLPIKGKGYYTAVTCLPVNVLQGGGGLYKDTRLFGSCSSKVQVIPKMTGTNFDLFVWNLSSTCTQIEKSCFFVCKAVISEENCKITEKVNNLLFIVICFLLVLNVSVHLIIYCLPVKIKNTFSSLFNQYIILNNKLGFTLPESSKFCYDITGELYHSIKNNKGRTNKVLELSVKNCFNQTTPGWDFYNSPTMGKFYLNPNGILSCLETDFVLYTAKSSCEQSALRDIFWYHEHFNYPTVIADHCLNIKEIVSFINKGFFPNEPSITGLTYKNKNADLDALINELGFKAPSKLKEQLREHNKMFFGSFQPAEHNLAINKKLSFHHRPTGCGNAKWKMYGSDVASIFRQYGINVSGVNNRKETRFVMESHLSVTNDISSIELKPKAACTKLQISFKKEENGIFAAEQYGDNSLNYSKFEISDNVIQENIGVSTGCLKAEIVNDMINSVESEVNKMEELRVNFSDKYKEIKDVETEITQKNEELNLMTSQSIKPVLSHLDDLKVISSIKSAMEKKKINLKSSVSAKYRYCFDDIMSTYSIMDLDTATSALHKLIPISGLEKYTNQLIVKLNVISTMEYKLDRNRFIDLDLELVSLIESRLKLLCRGGNKGNNKGKKAKGGNNDKANENTAFVGSVIINWKLLELSGDNISKVVYNKSSPEQRKLIRNPNKRMKKVKSNRPVVKLLHLKTNRTYRNISALEILKCLAWFKLQSKKPGISTLIKFCKRIRSNNLGEIKCTRWVKNLFWKLLEVKTKVPVRFKSKNEDQTNKQPAIKVNTSKDKVDRLTSQLLGKMVDPNGSLKEVLVEFLSAVIQVNN